MIEARTFWELVDRRAAATPDALMGLDESLRTMTFGGYRDAAEGLAAALYAGGVTAGTPVSWILPTRFDALILMAALARLGAVQIPILPIYRHREVGFCLRETGARTVIVPAAYKDFSHAGMVRELAADLGGLTVIEFGNALPCADPAALPPPPSSGDEVRWIFYTSGTTGSPKGARHTDRGVLESSVGMARAMDLGPHDRIALVFPVTHLGGANSLTAALFSGAGHLVVDAFFAPGVLDFLAAHGVTHAGAGTVFHQAYLAAQRARGDGPIFPAIRVFQGGGAPKPPQLHYDLKREIGGAGILSVYGMTECPIISLGRIGDPDEKLAYTEGQFNTPGTEYRVVDPDSGAEVAAGGEGELLLRAPQLCKGYVDESLNRDAFTADGFFRTGDLVRIDDGGNLIIVGRQKDVIIRKGENIAPLEIEQLLMRHPKVADVAVIGLPEEERGELCCAVVVTAGDEPITLAEMRSYLEGEKLMKQKIPEQLELVAALPKNPTGKVLKKDLKGQFSARVPARA